MKILIAPDSFKESMSAKEASLAINEGIKRYCQDIDTELCPLADGGEGTLETLVDAMNGSIEYYEVTGPVFEKVKAPIGYINQIAIIECATVCGLELLNESQKDPYQTTTYGLGELILHALEHNVCQIMIGLGGSATNDGGIGMLDALGVRFFDQNHQGVKLTMMGLKDIVEVDLSFLDQRIQDVKIIGVCDVTNPLCGINGATYIYGPQKGVKKTELSKVDGAMKHYATLIDTICQKESIHLSGSGAAGGLGFALMTLCYAQLRPGFEIVSETLQLEKRILSCDKVIVGEGKIDRQTQFGKTPYGVLKIAQKYNKDVYAFAGKVESLDFLKKLGFKNVFVITPTDMPLKTALMSGKENLEKTVFERMEEITYEI